MRCSTGTTSTSCPSWWPRTSSSRTRRPDKDRGGEGLRPFLAQMFEAFPDLRWRMEETVAEENRVAAWSTWEGTHRGTFLGVPPTGRSVSVEAWTIDYLRDGKLAESRILMDVMGLMQQLGVVGSPASTEPSATAT